MNLDLSFGRLVKDGGGGCVGKMKMSYEEFLGFINNKKVLFILKVLFWVE